MDQNNMFNNNIIQTITHFEITKNLLSDFIKISISPKNIYEEIIQYKNQNVIINFNNYLCEAYIEEIIQDDKQNFVYILGKERGI